MERDQIGDQVMTVISSKLTGPNPNIRAYLLHQQNRRIWNTITVDCVISVSYLGNDHTNCEISHLMKSVSAIPFTFAIHDNKKFISNSWIIWIRSTVLLFHSFIKETFYFSLKHYERTSWFYFAFYGTRYCNTLSNFSKQPYDKKLLIVLNICYLFLYNSFSEKNVEVLSSSGIF